MTHFRYRAKKSPRETVEGVIAAETKIAAIQKVAGMGFYPLRIDEDFSQNDIFRRKRKKIALKDATNFTRQLSNLLGSGLTVGKALEILGRQTENKHLRGVISDIRDSCVEGNPLSQALGKYPEIFPELYVSLIRSGEVSGALEDVLRRLADYSDKQLEIQTKVHSALAYPVLMAVVGLMTILVLLTFVIPKIAGMFEDLGQNLPLPTLILMRTSDAIKDYWWLILTAGFFAGTFLKKFYRTSRGRYRIDRLKLKAPLLGKLILKIEIARFAGTLGMLLKNGVSMLESLDIVRETMENKLVGEELGKVALKVRGGSSLADAMQGCPVAPPLLVNMIGVGEESGKIDDTLLKLSGDYEREADAAIKMMMSLLEPVMILVLGIIVGFIVISMLLPVFEINFMMR